MEDRLLGSVDVEESVKEVRVLQVSSTLARSIYEYRMFQDLEGGLSRAFRPLLCRFDPFRVEQTCIVGWATDKAFSLNLECWFQMPQNATLVTLCQRGSSLVYV